MIFSGVYYILSEYSDSLNRWSLHNYQYYLIIDFVLSFVIPVWFQLGIIAHSFLYSRDKDQMMQDGPGAYKGLNFGEISKIHKRSVVIDTLSQTDSELLSSQGEKSDCKSMVGMISPMASMTQGGRFSEQKERYTSFLSNQ